MHHTYIGCVPRFPTTSSPTSAQITPNSTPLQATHRRGRDRFLTPVRPRDEVARPLGLPGLSPLFWSQAVSTKDSWILENFHMLCLEELTFSWRCVQKKMHIMLGGRSFWNISGRSTLQQLESLSVRKKLYTPCQVVAVRPVVGAVISPTCFYWILPETPNQSGGMYIVFLTT